MGNIQRLIQRKQADALRRRRQRTLAVMVKYADKYKCSECFHRKTKSCADDMPNGCEQWVRFTKTGILREVA